MNRKPNFITYISSNMKCEENGCATSLICKLKTHNYILGTKHEQNYIGTQFYSKNFHIDFLVIMT